MPSTLRRRCGVVRERRSDETSCAMKREGVADVSDFVFGETVVGLWMKETRASEPGVW